jgi:hypothetical protein
VTNKAILTGTIRNPRGVGVANIVVDLKALGLNTTTNASGVYRFTELNAGHVTIETRANTSYLSATGEATLISGETYTKNITINDRFSVLYESFTSVVGGDGVSVTVTITGTVVNNGTSQAEGVSIQYSFTNNVGNNIGVGGPRPIGSLSGGESAPFTVTANLSEAYYNYVRTIGATN